MSLFASKQPELYVQNNDPDKGLTSKEPEENDLEWRHKIHREYQRDGRRQLSQLTDEFTSLITVSVSSELRIKPTLSQSIQRSLWANLAIIIVVLPLGLLTIALLYFDLKTSDLCFEWQHHNNSQIPIDIMRWKLIGHDIQAIFLNLWFPITLVLLFGWKEFKSNHLSTLYIGFAMGTAVIIYKTFLLVFGVFETHLFYRYPGNVLLLVGVIWSSILVARKIRKVYPWVSYSCLQIFTVISFDIIAGFLIAVVYRYAIVPYFNKLENPMYKVIVAAIAPVVALLPTAICKYFILWKSAETIEPERGFALLYFLRGTTIGLYRIMQADFNSIWLFIALSMLNGVFIIARKATQQIQEKILTWFVVFFKKIFCCTRHEKKPSNTPHHRRLRADTEIQNMLFEYTTLIMSQVYIVLYHITSFEISVWPVLKESLVRVTIGLGIDFVFNCCSILIQIHWYDIPIRRVWLKYWKRHMVAIAVVLTETVFYFTPVLLTVYQVRTYKSGRTHSIRNCTLPFNSWY